MLDAGQIAIESKLADKSALREIQEKRHSVYSDEDFEKLEALMYDTFTVKLSDTQVTAIFHHLLLSAVEPVLVCPWL